MLSLEGLLSPDLSIFIVNNFSFAINHLNINRVTFYRTKCLGMMALKLLPTSFFCYNSEGKSTEFSIPKIKLSRTDRAFSVKIL